MLSPAEVFQIICLIPVIGGSVYSILSVWTIIRFFSISRPDEKVAEEFKPPVTVLKPVRGLEKALKYLDKNKRYCLGKAGGRRHQGLLHRR